MKCVVYRSKQRYLQIVDKKAALLIKKERRHIIHFSYSGIILNLNY